MLSSLCPEKKNRKIVSEQIAQLASALMKFKFFIVASNDGWAGAFDLIDPNMCIEQLFSFSSQPTNRNHYSNIKKSFSSVVESYENKILFEALDSLVFSSFRVVCIKINV